MKRDVLKKMLQWKDDPERKPLILKGARQVRRQGYPDHQWQKGPEGITQAECHNNCGPAPALERGRIM